MKNKITPLKDAVANLIEDGDRLVMGAGLESGIPFAATHEIIRQGKKDLKIVAPISDASTDMMIGMGCASGIIGAWVGNVSGGLGHNYRRSIEQGVPQTVSIEDHSNFSLGMALLAGSYGIPYMPMRSILGSDIVKSNGTFIEADNPFSNEKQPIVLVPPLNPEVAIIPVQRSDSFGNSHYWGNTGLVKEAALASERIILLADEIVENDVITSDPSRVLFPGHRVSAVCRVPAGSHPSPLTGCWKRDNDFFNDYHKQSRDRDGFLAWIEEWVLDVADHAAYREKLGDRLDAMRIQGEHLSTATNWAAE